MVDYSRAATSRAAKESFDKAARSLIQEIQALQVEYEEEWKKVEELRKSRASLIENVIPILKSNEVKLARPLSKCNNSELMEELSNTVNSLDTTPQEEVKVAMVRIESRYGQLVKQAKKLDALYDRLSSYYVPEKDYGDEVVVSLKNAKKKQPKEEPKVSEVPEEEIKSVTLDTPVPSEELSSVTIDTSVPGEEDYASVYMAAEPIEETVVDLEVDETPLVDLSALDDLVPQYDEVVPPAEESVPLSESTSDYAEEPASTLDDMDFDAVSTYLDDFNDYNIHDLGGIFAEEEPQSDDELELVVSSSPANEELMESLRDLISRKRSNKQGIIYYDSIKNDEDPFDPEIAHSEADESEYCTYTLKDDQTLSQIVDYVYDGTLTWYDIYLYESNEDAINKRCEELNVDVADAATTPGMLTDLELKYPRALTPYQEQEAPTLKAA